MPVLDGDANGSSGACRYWEVENPFYGDHSGQDGGGTQISLWNQIGAVVAPAGAAFSLVETPPFASPADPFYRFDLSAWDLATGEPVTTFRESLTLTLSYSETAVVGLNEASLRLVSWDPATAGWLPLQGEVDLVENRITAALGHFSLLGAQGDPAAVVAETFKAYQTDLFAGSAGYGFDLEAPSGPNGLAPSLSLRYNSGAVNQMKAPYSPGTWVGSG